MKKGTTTKKSNGRKKAQQKERKNAQTRARRNRKAQQKQLAIAKKRELRDRMFSVKRLLAFRDMKAMIRKERNEHPSGRPEENLSNPSYFERLGSILQRSNKSPKQEGVLAKDSGEGSYTVQEDKKTGTLSIKGEE